MLALARLIIRSYLNDDFKMIIIEGDRRIGKSAYALKSMREALQHLKGFDLFESIERDLPLVMGWHPLQVSEYWLSLVERIPCYTWDDAGMWLFSLDWNEPELKELMKYMNVQGTDINIPMYTTPSANWILNKLRNAPDVLKIKIIKRTGSNALAQLPQWERFARIAKCYRPWSYPDGKGGGVNKIWEDHFSCKLPDKVYNYYNPIRNLYAKMAKKKMIQVFRSKMKEDEIYKEALTSSKRLLGLENVKSVEDEKVIEI